MLFLQRFHWTRANGVYDVMCALSLLGVVPWMRHLHLSMVVMAFTTPLAERMFAYWILTYGIVRCCSDNMRLVALTYVLEAACIIHEYYVHHTFVAVNTVCTAACCLGIAWLIVR